MKIKNLLVHLDPDPLCESRTRFAVQLARDLDAHLLGDAPTGLLKLPGALGMQEGTSLQDLGHSIRTAMERRAHDCAERFRDTCRMAGIPAFEALVDWADEAASLIHHAHCADLVILSQADPNGPDHHRKQSLVEQVVLECGRPTLILPYAGRHDSIGASVLVAWDDSREATRAIDDALPLLRCAERVHVMRWRKASASAAVVPASLDALQRWLHSHGVAATTHVEATDIDVANALLSRAADLGADLIVTGAYGHARWAERVMGGVTRTLLASMTVPVLMSH